MIKSFFERVRKAFDVLVGKEEELITEVKKDTELYNLVQTNMLNIELAPIREKIESIEKILYHTTKSLVILTGQAEENKRLLTEQTALTEEMIYVFEQLMKSVTPDHYSATESDLYKPPKRRLN